MQTETLPLVSCMEAKKKKNENKPVSNKTCLNENLLQKTHTHTLLYIGMCVYLKFTLSLYASVISTLVQEDTHVKMILSLVCRRQFLFFFFYFSV